MSVYYPRLLRDGWRRVGSRQLGQTKSIDYFEKELEGGWILRKIAHKETGPPKGKGCYWDEHELVHVESNNLIRNKDWEWADVDGPRLVWAVNGKLMTGCLGRGELKNEITVYDFNTAVFQELKAPY